VKTGNGRDHLLNSGTSQESSNGIKMDLKEIDCNGVNWIEVALGRVQWQALLFIYGVLRMLSLAQSICHQMIR
jgi:hypothetical protein